MRIDMLLNKYKMHLITSVDGYTKIPPTNCSTLNKDRSLTISNQLKGSIS